MANHVYLGLMPPKVREQYLRMFRQLESLIEKRKPILAANLELQKVVKPLQSHQAMTKKISDLDQK